MVSYPAFITIIAVIVTCHFQVIDRLNSRTEDATEMIEMLDKVLQIQNVSWLDKYVVFTRVLTGQPQLNICCKELEVHVYSFG